MLFVLVICKPPYILWFTILKHRRLIVNFFIFSVYSSPVTVHTPLSRKVFWHEYAKIPRHTSQNSIAAGNLE